MTHWNPDPNQERAIQAAFDGYVPAAELASAKAEIERLRAFIESLDGKHICICADGGTTFIDDGIVVASDILGKQEPRR